MYSWSRLKIPRFYGLDLQTNVIDVPNGVSLGCENVYQSQTGTISKRRGWENVFYQQFGVIQELGTITIGAVKWYFVFADGYAYVGTNTTTPMFEIVVSPSIDLSRTLHWAIADNKVYFVDGVSKLRYIKFDSVPNPTVEYADIPLRPLINPISVTGTAGASHTYKYTVSNSNGESPAYASTTIAIIPTGAVVRIPLTYVTGNNIQNGWVVKIYASLATVASTSILVATYTWTATDTTATFANITTTAINDLQPQLYTELGIAGQQSAPVGLTGLTTHYGRLVAWKDSKVYNAFYDNPNAWPAETAINEAFVYGFAIGDETITTCVSYQESLFVMKPSRIAIFGGLGPDNTGNNAYSFNRLETNGIGCVAPKSAKVVGDEGVTQLVFLSSNGFYSTTGSKPIRIGQKIQAKVQEQNPTTLATAVSYYNKSIGHYVCTYNGVTWVLDLRSQIGEDEQVLYGWYSWTGITTNSYFYDGDRYLFAGADGFIYRERVTRTLQDYRQDLMQQLALKDVFLEDNKVTLGGDFATGTPIQFKTSAIAGISPSTDYYLISLGGGVYSLATTQQNALDNISITFLASVSSTEFLVRFYYAIVCQYTTNWINFRTSSEVKKLLKPTVIFFPESANILATSENIKFETAVDWDTTFVDIKSLNLGSGNRWGVLPWGTFAWGASGDAHPRNIDTKYRKIRSIKYRMSNDNMDEGFNLLSFEQEYSVIRNRGNYYSQVTT